MTNGPENQPGRTVPARVLAPPASVSAHARTALDTVITAPPYPAVDDLPAWRSYVDGQHQAMLSSPRYAQLRNAGVAAQIELGGVRAYEVVPDGLPDTDDRVYLDIHGGAFVVGGGELCRAMTASNLSKFDCRIVSVDYRMPPEHPYPAALDDCLAAYRALLDAHPAGRIVVGGTSAGANLAGALMLRARDEGLPLPAAVLLLTPELDLTESGDSFQTNLGVDSVLTRSLMPANLLYANGHQLSDPYLSPLFGDFTKGYPPTFLQTGTRDLFLSNAVRMHRALRAAEIPVELHVFEAMPHGGFHGAPEDRELNEEIRRFTAEQWATGGGTRRPAGQRAVEALSGAPRRPDGGTPVTT